jgi:bifunctional non-homologous end joining protein LigD
VPLTFPVAPMKASLGGLPADDERWAYEVKWDGYRTIAFVGDGGVRFQSTNLHDVTPRYPELAGLAEDVHASTAVLDAEMVVLDDAGHPRFDLIQRHEREAVLQVFDVLRIDDHDTIALPYEDRRRLLDELVTPGENWVVPGHRIGGGAELLEATGAAGLEGVMAKRLGSTYTPGKRTQNWRKIKHRRRAELVIGGYTAGDGNRASTFGSLLVGRRESDRLAFAGGVGTGFDQARLESLVTRFRDLETPTCPFDPPPPRRYLRTARWIEPVLTATVEMTEFTNEGLVRQASFIDLREDTR